MTSIWKIGVLVLVLVVILPSLNAAWSNDSLTAGSAANESISVDYTSESSVDADAAEYSSTVTVRNETGVSLENGTDYVWDGQNGTVDWQNTDNTDDGDTAYIDYEYHARTQTTSLAHNTLNVLGAVIPILVVVVVVYGSYRFAAAGGGRGGL